MRQYEAMYIVDADLPEEQIAAIIEKYKKVVNDNGGAAGEAGKWEQGRRKLAYEVAKHREGFYILMQFESGTEAPRELDRIFRISDDVFRHLIVRREEPKAAAKPEEAAAKPDESIPVQQEEAVPVTEESEPGTPPSGTEEAASSSEE